MATEDVVKVKDLVDWIDSESAAAEIVLMERPDMTTSIEVKAFRRTLKEVKELIERRKFELKIPKPRKVKA